MNNSGGEKQRNQTKHARLASRNPLLYTLAMQLLAVTPVATVLGFIDRFWLGSFVLGVLVYAVPNAYFTFYAFRYRENSQQIAQSFFAGEFGKLALIVAGFALVFKFVSPLHMPSLLVGFIGLIILQWFIAWQITKT